MIAPEWAGQTAFIVGGGPSVLTQPIERLQGRRVIAVNSSYQRCPFADFLFFGDRRWYAEHRNNLKSFAGRIATIMSSAPPPLIQLKRRPPIRLSKDRNEVSMRRTSMTGAINLAFHLGANRIVLLGLDGRHIDGRRNHHEPHKWRHVENCWKEHRDELAGISPDLAGIEVLNASPGSAIDIWPIVQLQQVLE